MNKPVLTSEIKLFNNKFYHRTKEVSIPEQLQTLLKGKLTGASINVKVEDVEYL